MLPGGTKTVHVQQTSNSDIMSRVMAQFNTMCPEDVQTIVQSVNTIVEAALKEQPSSQVARQGSQLWKNLLVSHPERFMKLITTLSSELGWSLTPKLVGGHYACFNWQLHVAEEAQTASPAADLSPLHHSEAKDTSIDEFNQGMLSADAELFTPLSITELMESQRSDSGAQSEQVFGTDIEVDGQDDSYERWIVQLLEDNCLSIT